MYKEVFQVVKYPCHPYCITYRFVASCASTNSETAAPLDSTLLDSLGVPRREIQIAAPFWFLIHLFQFFICCFLNYFLFDILTAECHAAAVAPRQRCSGVEAPPQRKVYYWQVFWPHVFWLIYYCFFCVFVGILNCQALTRHAKPYHKGILQGFNSKGILGCNCEECMGVATCRGSNRSSCTQPYFLFVVFIILFFCVSVYYYLLLASCCPVAWHPIHNHVG